MKILERLAHFLYPENTVCVACGALRVDHHPFQLCAGCAKELKPQTPPFCPRCGRPGWLMECPECMLSKPDALDGRRAAFSYRGVPRKLIQALKYNSVSVAALALADGMAKVLPEEPFEAIVPVPLHWIRQQQRGFNQAELLGNALSGLSGIPIKNTLERVRATQTQTLLTKEGRAANVREAFTAGAPMDGLSLLLIDDVLTTGATAGACAEALKAAGAAKVALIAAAQAGDWDDEGEA